MSETHSPPLSLSRAASGLSAPETPGRSRLLFFSGGTALKDTARELAAHAPDCVYLVTPFDSGGSSASLRRAFAMPAVGDARSRIMALADVQRQGHPEVYTLFAYRLPTDEPSTALCDELTALVRGDHPLLRQVPPPMNAVIREHLAQFALRMPSDFPLAGASVGNLVLTAGYLCHDRRLDPALGLFSDLLHARGTVRTVVEETAHLAVRLASGAVIVGQHRFTGKETGRIDSPITDIWLATSETDPEPADVAVSAATADMIRTAAGLCFPVGSFYSSVVANLLPKGVGRAVAANPGRKIFVPNLGADPELLGHTLAMQVERLLRPLLADAPEATAADMLTLLLLDEDHERYPGGVPEEMLRGLGIGIVSRPLVAEGKGPLADARLLASALRELAGCGA